MVCQVKPFEYRTPILSGIQVLGIQMVTVCFNIKQKFLIFVVPGAVMGNHWSSSSLVSSFFPWLIVTQISLRLILVFTWLPLRREMKQLFLGLHLSALWQLPCCEHLTTNSLVDLKLHLNGFLVHSTLDIWYLFWCTPKHKL